LTIEISEYKVNLRVNYVMDENIAQHLDLILSALAHAKRRAIIHELSLQPSTINRLAIKFGMSLPSIYKHLRILEKSQLIARKKSGRTNFVAFNQKTFAVAQTWVMQYQTQWGNPEASLANYIARMQE
jgi:DNA-binding transcriptional ArsR family regulator